MNESEKALIQYLKLNYGLRYKNGNFIPSRPIFAKEEQLELEQYTDQILIYEPIQDNVAESAWDSFTNKYAIKNDDKFEKIEDQKPLLAKTDIKLIIPVLRVTYFCEPSAENKLSTDNQSFGSDNHAIEQNYQEFLSREVLVGGYLIIKNIFKYSDNSLEFDQLKAHIVWAINEACWKRKNLFKSAIMRPELRDIEDSNGNHIHDMETLANYLNQLYEFETAAIVAYEKVVPKGNTIIFDTRLIPGITNYHRELTMERWVQDNLHLNLPLWIKEYQLDRAMVLTSYGFVPGTKPALEFLSLPSIEREKQTNLNFSILLNSKNYINYTYDVSLKGAEIPFLTFDTRSINNQCNIFVSQCDIFHEKFLWEHQISKPSQQLIKDIRDALDNTNPYKSLTKVFSEYGHVIRTEITMRGTLDSSSDTEYIAYDNSDKNLYKIDNISWKSLINQPKTIPLYEILDEEVKRQIQKLSENKQEVLMTGVTRINNKTRYYRVNFNYLLSSDNYQVIGCVTMNNNKLEGLNVKFQLTSVSGFSIIMEEYKKLKEIEGDLEVVWQIIGKPNPIGYFSNNTRNTEVFNTNFSIEISKNKTSKEVYTWEKLSSEFIIATSIQYPPTNYEPMLQVVVKSWSGQKIELDIINHSFDSIDLNYTNDMQDNERIEFEDYKEMGMTDNVKERIVYKVDIALYAINPNQQESVIADITNIKDFEKCKQISWELIGDKLRPDMVQNGYCGKCGEQYTDKNNEWCKPCAINTNLKNWSGNKNIDNLIQEMRLKINSYNDIIFEWIPYNQFTNIKEIGLGGFSIVYSAIWNDGQLYYDIDKKKYIRNCNEKVALKRLVNSQDISNEFLNEVKAHSVNIYSNILPLYGISQDPNTGDYIIVLKYAEGGNLVSWVNKNYRDFNWKNKLKILTGIAEGLTEIHQHQMVHRDFHSGNILLNNSNIYISDMGLCSDVANVDNTRIYGVLPYIAPEVLKRKAYTQKADIYSFGMIMYFIATGKQPFPDRAHDENLILDICKKGIRPKVSEQEIPRCYIDLMEKCWSSNPVTRPDIIEIRELLHTFYNSEKQFEKAEEYRIANLSSADNGQLTIHPQAIYTSRVLIPYHSQAIYTSRVFIPYTATITVNLVNLPKYYDNISNSSVEVIDFTDPKWSFPHNNLSQNYVTIQDVENIDSNRSLLDNDLSREYVTIQDVENTDSSRLILHNNLSREYVTFQVGKNQNIREFRAHYNILKASSPYFESALSDRWTTKNNDKFEKPNINPAIFEMILKHIYTGKMDLTKQSGENILELLVASDELLLEELVMHIQDFLIKEQTTWIQQNFVIILNTVKNSSCKELQDYCLKSICADPQSFFTSKGALLLDKDILYELLKRDDLQIEQIIVWNYLIKWGIEQTPGLGSSNNDRNKWGEDDFEALKKTLNQFIPFIRFVDMSPADFNDNVGPYKSVIPHHILLETIHDV